MSETGAASCSKSFEPLSLPQALEMLAEAFDTPVEAIGAGVRRDQLPGWDSMGSMLLMSELDDRFGLELTADEVRAMVGVDDLLAFLRKHGVLNG